MQKQTRHISQFLAIITSHFALSCGYLGCSNEFAGCSGSNKAAHIIDEYRSLNKACGILNGFYHWFLITFHGSIGTVASNLPQSTAQLIPYNFPIPLG